MKRNRDTAATAAAPSKSTHRRVKAKVTPRPTSIPTQWGLPHLLLPMQYIHGVMTHLYNRAPLSCSIIQPGCCGGRKYCHRALVLEYLAVALILLIEPSLVQNVRV